MISHHQVLPIAIFVFIPTDGLSQVADSVVEFCQEDDGLVYRSDSEPLYREIEEFQAESLRRGGYPLWQKEPKAQNTLEGLCESLATKMGWKPSDCDDVSGLVMNLTIPTRCESSGPFFLADNLMKNVVAIADSVFEDELPEFAVGTVQMQSINAGVFQFDSGKAVLFNTHLFAFVNEMTKMMSAGIEFTEESNRVGLDYAPENAKGIFQANPFYKERFAQLVHYFLTGQNKPEAWMPEKNSILLYSRLTTWVETFIAAHEYGHVYRDHKVRNDHLGELTPHDVCQNWKNEFEADRIGLYLTLHAASRDPFFELYKSAPDLWFFAAAVLDEARQIMLNGMDEEQSDALSQRLLEGCFGEDKSSIEELRIPVGYPHRTHPPTAARLVRAWEAKAQMLESENVEEDANWGIVLLALWAEARPVFTRMVQGDD